MTTSRTGTAQPRGSLKTVSELIVDCLINEQVAYVFGLPGEENIYLIDALSSSIVSNQDFLRRPRQVILVAHNLVFVSETGAFMMNSQELETAVREGTPFVTLIWRDEGNSKILQQVIGRAHMSN